MTGRQQMDRRTDGPEQQIGEMAEAVRDNLENLREGVTEQASALTRTLRERGQTAFDEQKLRAATELQHLGAAVRRAADKLHDQNSEALAGYVDTAATALDGVARYVEEAELMEIAQEVEQFARRRPALIVGGMFVAGLALGRFVKAAQPVQSPQHNRRPQAQGSRGTQSARKQRNND